MHSYGSLQIDSQPSAALHMTDQVLHPCKATSKIIFVYVSVITFFQLQMGRLLPGTNQMTLLAYIRFCARTHARISPCVPKARINPPHHTHTCDRQTDICTDYWTRPDHDHRTVLRSFTPCLVGVGCSARTSRQYEVSYCLPYTHTVHPPHIHAGNTQKGCSCLSDTTLHLHYQQLMVNAVNS